MMPSSVFYAPRSSGKVYALMQEKLEEEARKTAKTVKMFIETFTPSSPPAVPPRVTKPPGNKGPRPKRVFDRRGRKTC